MTFTGYQVNIYGLFVVGICTMSESPGQLYTINSVKVQFPCKAYPSQLSMMDKVRICCVLYMNETLIAGFITPLLKAVLNPTHPT